MRRVFYIGVSPSGGGEGIQGVYSASVAGGRCVWCSIFSCSLQAL